MSVSITKYKVFREYFLLRKISRCHDGLYLAAAIISSVDSKATVINLSLCDFTQFLISDQNSKKILVLM